MINILLLNWKSKKPILECLESFNKIKFNLSQIVIVDNFSDDGSLKIIRNKYHQIKILEMPQNLGFAEGNNQGFEYLLSTDAEYIFVLNPDTEVNKNTIPELIKVMKKDKNIGITGPKILSADGLLWSCGGYIDKKRFTAGLIGIGENDKGQYETMKDVDYITGTAMMVRREILEKSGLFYPGYFIYYEDVEMNVRVRRAGYRCIYVPGSEIIHKESSSMGKSSPSQSYYLARNHLLFTERNAPVSVKIRETIRMPKTLNAHWKKNERYAVMGICDYFLRRFGKRDYWS